MLDKGVLYRAREIDGDPMKRYNYGLEIEEDTFKKFSASYSSIEELAKKFNGSDFEFHPGATLTTLSSPEIKNSDIFEPVSLEDLLRFKRLTLEKSSE